jgi:thiol-disulfide isomerase/thioredoxin
MLGALCAVSLSAQRLKGHIGGRALAGKTLMLLQDRGSDTRPIDSVKVGLDGDFRFKESANAVGFYRLALNDTDQVDLILDPREPLVDLEFDSIPLEYHVHVRTSDENKRLWEYKEISRETQAVQATVFQQKQMLQPGDTAGLAALDSTAMRADRMKAHYLAQLVGRAPTSYFAKVVTASEALEGLHGKGPMAVAKVFDFSDPGLLRSSVYDKAVMTFLQNLNAINEEQFSNAADSLMALAAKDAECHAYMLDHLVDLFSTYGPEVALQHVIDQYVAPLGNSAVVDPKLRARVDALMKLSVGGQGPEEQMNDHGTLVLLSRLVKDAKYTALFFYSSTCEHCHAQMPTLKTDYDRFRAKGFNVIGIALDADSVDFLTSIKENEIPWKCYSHFIGWGEPAAKDYLVKATPTFYLLDAKMTIVAKPTDAEELGNKLKELLP